MAQKISAEKANLSLPRNLILSGHEQLWLVIQNEFGKCVETTS